MIDNDLFNNALITGGSGMVGTNIDFGIKPSSTELNVTDLKSINKYMLSIQKNISCIIHLASINLRECEQNIPKAISVNINSTINMLALAKEKDIPFILVSTGAVFSTTDINKSFTENNDKNPNCIYGITKSTSEDIALLYQKSIVV